MKRFELLPYLTLLASLAMAMATGCAVGTRVAAGHDDYRLYREARLSHTLEGRLAASHRYLRDVPQGRYRKEVWRRFKVEEPEYFRAAQNSLPRLRAYLLAMPDGPHAREVTTRIVELETEIGFAKSREQRTLTSARQVQSEVQAAANQRRALVRQFSDWLELLAGIDSWGQPTSALDHELIYRFRLEPPVGACAGDRCRKSVEIAYAIPEQGRLSVRSAVLDVEFVLAEGGVVSATLSGPELFSRVGEALELRAVRAGRPQTRVEAIGRVLPVLENTLEERLPQARCARPSVSPVIFERACDGLRVSVIAGEGGQDRDRVLVEPWPIAGAAP